MEFCSQSYLEYIGGACKTAKTGNSAGGIFAPKVTLSISEQKGLMQIENKLATEPVGILFPKILLSISEQIVFHAKLYNGRQSVGGNFASKVLV